jgi:opacity protein-like surface antigen
MKLPGNLGLKASSIRYISTGVAALGVLAFAAQADAADIYAPGPGPAPFPVAAPVALWSGFYGGAHIGGAWANLSTHDLDAYWYTDIPNIVPNYRDYGVLHTDQSPSGVFGGGTVGYNGQRGGVVFGIEADFGAIGLNSNKLISVPVLNPLAVPTASAHASTGFYGDVTGRVGWAWGPWLLYGKGGLAVLQATTNVSDFDGTYRYHGSVDETRVGWTAGGGLEYLWNPAWSVKVEYQYFDFGTTSSSLTGVDGLTYNFDNRLDINTVKVGLNYHLGVDNAFLPPLK